MSGLFLSAQAISNILVSTPVTLLPGILDRTGYAPHLTEGVLACAQQGRLFWLGNTSGTASPFGHTNVRAMTLLNQGHIQHPFTSYLIACNVTSGGETGTVVQLCACMDRDIICALIVPVKMSDGSITMYMTFAAVNRYHETNQYEFQLLLVTSDIYDIAPDATRELQVELLSTVFQLVLALNTRDLPVEAHQPSRQVRRALARAGKPSWQFYSVDPSYITTISKDRGRGGESRGGTHASPVPHVRRGHVRTLVSGVQTWVRDCLVNGKKGTPGSRAFYELKGAGL